MVFVDTSALYALLDGDDPAHPCARQTLEQLRDARESLLTHNYVLVETTALAQRRLGLAAVSDLRDAITPLLRIAWVDHDLHAQALAATLASQRRPISLVDRVSFDVMRRRRVTRAYAFDEHFAEQGFELVPGLAG